ncbi:hypothetical protein ACLB2K_031560 [Fragaria x ananassa]
MLTCPLALCILLPMEADGPVWGALLNACKIHGNEEMVERIRDGLRNSAQLSTGTLALLSNAYAKHDRWDDSNKIQGTADTSTCDNPRESPWTYQNSHDYQVM